MSIKLHFPLTLDINFNSPPPVAHSPIDITADIHPQFFQLLALAEVMASASLPVHSI
jgi:hypothetical protein